MFPFNEHLAKAIFRWLVSALSALCSRLLSAMQISVLLLSLSEHLESLSPHLSLLFLSYPVDFFDSLPLLQIKGFEPLFFFVFAVFFQRVLLLQVNSATDRLRQHPSGHFGLLHSLVHHALLLAILGDFLLAEELLLLLFGVHLLQQVFS